MVPLGCPVDKAVGSALYDIDRDDYEARIDQSRRLNQNLTQHKTDYRQDASRILHAVWE